MSERAKALEAFSRPDPNDNAERMLTEISQGVPKGDALSVHDAASSALWDRMAEGIQAAQARGLVIDYDVPD